MTAPNNIEVIDHEKNMWSKTTGSGPRRILYPYFTLWHASKSAETRELRSCHIPYVSFFERAANNASDINLSARMPTDRRWISDMIYDILGRLWRYFKQRS